ncbi:MAG TPA: ribosome biogenesis GTP-binding protein YihA/YsxC [Bacillota bacterium]|nr:ribosome biogenesis GTP-binding protein YihA/YsxC [Bacillota bacterium]
MKIDQAKFIISAVKEEQYPKNRFPEIALAGRSNVGKSSLINRLIQRRDLARTSSKPGKTQTLNFYEINEKFYFVDVPGYGYAKVSKQERNKWGEMMETYFETRGPLKCIILITDLRHKPTEDDKQMYAYMKYLQLPAIIVATKADKVKRNQRKKHIEQMKTELQVIDSDPLIPFSAVTGEGKDIVWRELKRFL